MTRYERLLENYEDAYFALLMEEVAQEEGARLEQLNIELQGDPAAKVPEELNRKCLKTIDKYYMKQQKKSSLRIVRKALNVAAIIIAMATLMFTTAFAISEDVRIATANLVLTVTEEYTQLNMMGEPANSGHSEDNSIFDDYFTKMKIQWLPEHFSYCAGKPDLYVRFQNSDEDWIMITQVEAKSVNVDTEGADKVENIVINDMQGLCISKNGETHIIVAQKEKQFYIDLAVSKNVDRETAIKIVENIAVI